MLENDLRLLASAIAPYQISAMRQLQLRLSAGSPRYQHAIKNLALIATSLFFLPLSVVILLVSLGLRPLLYSYNYVIKFGSQLSRSEDGAPRSKAPSRRTVLVTGVSMTKGLTLAREFQKAGHRVIGADFAPFGWIPAPGRFSAAVDKFYTLHSPNEKDGDTYYIHGLLQIIHKEEVELWVTCSGLFSALEDARAREVIERRSDCICIQPDVATTELLHSKDAFIEHTASIGLPVPETHNVTSRAAVHKVLHQSPRTKRKYIMKTVGIDDPSRLEGMTLLPRRTLSETYNHVASLDVSPSNPWVLQQFVTGKKEYCTHALVIRGKVKAFVACPSSDLVMYYEPLSPDNSLFKAMLRFTEKFISRSSSRRRFGSEEHIVLPPITGHISFDFLVEEIVTEKGTEFVLRVIECNPRAHTALVGFRDRGKDLADAYFTALDPRPANVATNHIAGGETLREKLNGHVDPSTPASPSISNETEAEAEVTMPEGITNALLAPDPIVYAYPGRRYRWIGHDIVTLLLFPPLQIVSLPLLAFIDTIRTISNFNSTTSLRERLTAFPCALASLLFHAYPEALSIYAHSVATFVTNLLTWHDGTYEIWDPLPIFMLYHVFFPALWAARTWSGRKGWWSRCNVSTGRFYDV